MDPESLQQQWVAERPIYERLCTEVRNRIEREARERSLVCQVDHRAKDVASLLKGALRRGFTYEQIRDKAGVRIIVPYSPLVPDAIQLVETLFTVRARKDLGAQLNFSEVGYQGMHFEVALRDEVERDLVGLVCEIQVQTRAQRLWADLSHELAYKPLTGIPAAVMRRIYRLASLVEIFDDQAALSKKEILAMPEMRVARVLATLEKHYYRFTGRGYDRELSVFMLSRLLESYDATEEGRFEFLMEAFAVKNRDKLSDKFESYKNDDRCSILLFQPECFLIFERLETNEPVLRHTWSQYFEDALLEPLIAIWG